MSLSKLRRCRTAATLVSLSIWLTGCAASTEVLPLALPTIPAGLAACTAESVPPIPGALGTALTKAQAAEALADQRASALAKSRCARDWAALYDDLRSKK